MSVSLWTFAVLLFLLSILTRFIVVGGLVYTVPVWRREFKDDLTATSLLTWSGSELLATYLLRKLKRELLGKTVLLPATVMDQAHRAVPALNGCQSANINRLRLALMSRSWCAPQAHVHSRTSIAFFSPFTPQEEQICVDAYQGSALMNVRP